MKKQYLWKSLKSGLRSDYNNSPWVMNEWREENAPTKECIGLNASPRIIDAMRYVDMEILAKVEVSGKIIKGTDKWTCQNMKIVEAYIWTKEESVRLAIFSAEMCLDHFEKAFPGDDRPRKAIQAAKNWLKNPTEKNRKAAGYAAGSAWSAAGSAWSAAWSAAGYAAGSAAGYAAGYAAGSAAGYAAGSAWSAWSAARYAAGSATLDAIEKYILGRIEHLEKWEE